MISSKYDWNTFMLFSSFTLSENWQEEHYAIHTPFCEIYLQTDSIRMVARGWLSHDRQNVRNRDLGNHLLSVARGEEEVPSGQLHSTTIPV